ncbi:MAG: hypothetical protein ACE5GQ_02905 [Nitrospinales bacterium]
MLFLPAIAVWTQAEGSPALPQAVSVSQPVATVPLVPREEFKQLGFLLPSLDSMGAIVRNPNQRIALATGETVYIDLGFEDGIEAGNLLSIVSSPRAVYPPDPIDYPSSESGGWSEHLGQWVKSLFSLREDLHSHRTVELRYAQQNCCGWFPFKDKPLGYLVRTLGTLEVLETEGSFSKAVIMEAFQPIIIGSRLIPYRIPKVPGLPKDYTPPAKDIHGFIVALEESFSLASERDIVYIDKGEAQNVELGDRFEIYAYTGVAPADGSYGFSWPQREQTAPLVIGELQIVATQQDTATAVIRKHSQEMFVGQRVRYVPGIKTSDIDLAEPAPVSLEQIEKME